MFRKKYINIWNAKKNMCTCFVLNSTKKLISFCSRYWCILLYIFIGYWVLRQNKKLLYIIQHKGYIFICLCIKLWNRRGWWFQLSEESLAPQHRAFDCTYWGGRMLQKRWKGCIFFFLLCGALGMYVAFLHPRW